MVKRGDGFFCGRCAVSRDWEEVIAVIQDASVETPVAGGSTVRVGVRK